MIRSRFVKNILKMENESIAADLVLLARKNPSRAERKIAALLDYHCTEDGLQSRIDRANCKVDMIVEIDHREKQQEYELRGNKYGKKDSKKIL